MEDSKILYALPYDAEVEYLQGTGTQYIDTGILFDSTYKYELTISDFANGTTGLRCFGARSQNAVRPKSSYMTYYGESGKLFFYAGNNLPDTAVGAAGVTVTLNIKRRIRIGVYPTCYCYINDADNHTTPGNMMQAVQFRSEYNVYLYTENSAGSAIPRSCKIYRYYVRDASDVPVQDFIPVRVGTIGYFYDRVSRSLFGNAGSGYFTVGPDV